MKKFFKSFLVSFGIMLVVGIAFAPLAMNSYSGHTPNVQSIFGMDSGSGSGTVDPSVEVLSNGDVKIITGPEVGIGSGSGR